MTARHAKIFSILNMWWDGEEVDGLKRPAPQTMYELVDIASGAQDTTINSEVIKVLDFCDIKYKVDGIGWRII